MTKPIMWKSHQYTSTRKSNHMKTTNSSPKNWNDIVFENRNKSYGAYELRTNYQPTLVKSFLYTLLGFSLVTSLCISLKQKGKQLPQIALSTEHLTFQQFQFETKKFEIVASTTPAASAARVIEDSYKIVSDLVKPAKPATDPSDIPIDPGNPVANPSPGNAINPEGAAGPAAAMTASTAPFSIVSVDKVPEFPGGERKLLDFLSKNIHYSIQAKEAEVTGRIYASFIINSQGQIETIKILHGLGFGLDEEVIRVLNLCPKWQPGMFEGKAVSTIMNLPVSFTLNR